MTQQVVHEGLEVDLRPAEHNRSALALSLEGALDGADVELMIDDVAELAGMTARNVRAYQQRRLLPPARRNGRRLVYGWEHVARLRLVRSLHSRGLSLKVIEDLVSRGAAEAELARLNEESAPGGVRLRVPLGDLSIEALRTENPQAIRELVDAGVVHVEDGELVASSAALGVAGALLGLGVDLQAIFRVVLLASRAANGVAERMHHEISAIEGIEPETAALAMRLASLTFSDMLLDNAAQHDLDKQVDQLPPIPHQGS